MQDVDLAAIPGVHSAFAVRLTVPRLWEVEVVPEIEAVNLYDPTAPGATSREQSQIFLRHFRANDFLTLSTVTIHERTATEIVGRPVVTYVIEKKPGIADFPHQPSWRNARHRVTDVRLSDTRPSEFLVVGKRPDLPDTLFGSILSSLRPSVPVTSVVLPVPGFFDNITKKPFGLFVTPSNSPVEPERFHGYHSAADIERPANTPVVAIADGTVIRSAWVSGYGGLVVLEHRIDGRRLLGVYGHLDPAQLPRIGATIQQGEQVGILGDGYSRETDNERPHLHFGLYAGSGVDIRGYVQNKSELDDWLDPVVFFREHGVQSSGQ